MKTLTARQQQIADLIAEGKRTKEISGILGVRHSTIDNHCKAMMERLGVHGMVRLRAHLMESRKVDQVFNANEGTGNKPIWLPVPPGFNLNQPVYDVVRRTV